MHDASLNHRTAGFLTRGQTSSSDSQASINFGRKRGEGTGCVSPVVLRVKIGRPSSVVQEKSIYRKPKQDPGSHAACSKQQS